MAPSASTRPTVEEDQGPLAFLAHLFGGKGKKDKAKKKVDKTKKPKRR